MPRRSRWVRMAASPFTEAGRPSRRLAGMLAGASLVLGLPSAGAGAETPYWLQFGKPARTCPGAAEMPFKVEGASWGVLASGVVTCRQAGDTYVYDLQFLNVLVDPLDRDMITRDALEFDWCGLALFKATAQGDDVDWLYDRSVPIKGELRKTATGRIVFGHLSFTVPKDKADAATNMIFYITFDGPLVVIHAV